MTESNPDPMPPPLPQSPPVPPASAAPPTQRSGVAPPPPPPAWPKVIGIIAIVLGSLGLLAAVWGIVSALLGDFFLAMIPEGEEGAAQLAVMQRYMPWMAAVAALNGVLAVWLIVGGAGLVSRRPWSRPVLISWAAAKAVAVVVGAVMNYFMQMAMFEAMPQQGAGAPPPGVMAMATLVGVVFSLAFGWAFPGFMLVWLSRGSVSDEVRRWRGGV